jgi:hypothetical protein
LPAEIHDLRLESNGKAGNIPDLSIIGGGKMGMAQLESPHDKLSNHCLFLGGGFHIRKVSFGFSPDFDVSTPHCHLPFLPPHCLKRISTQSLPDLFYFIRTTQWGD